MSACMLSYAASMRPRLAANPVQNGRRDTLLQLPLFMELDQLGFMILCQSVHKTREPVPLLPEQVGLCQQGLDVSLHVFEFLAKRIRELISDFSVMYYVFEFLLSLSMVFISTDSTHYKGNIVVSRCMNEITAIILSFPVVSMRLQT